MITGYGSTASVIYAKVVRNIHPLDQSGSVFALKIVEKKQLREADSVSRLFDYPKLELRNPLACIV